MNSFTLQVFDSQKDIQIQGVTSFVGEDESGSFGILPGHARFMTVLVLGLASFRCGKKLRQYLAMPGAVLYFSDNILNLVCRHCMIDENYDHISRLLSEELLAEEEQLREVRQSLKRMEEALLKRMWKIRRQGITLS
ncbi:F0F1 ATP synthase subunit epsilon [Desulfopila sp. IMCC35008]|uniref:F0F1 ATP synthase subunit epsilon n=1 Tax=Desulfopila sp. IMCC35008 TaxID=2653858 RepID=UPI0013D51FB2|nr:F0F1 ATP synthase subunit epsilon [Desulfopila sp. IMCC35008]